MKKIIVLFLLFFPVISFAQTNVYTFNDGPFLSEKEVRSAFGSIKETLPSSLVLTTIIYHRSVKKDTVINYTTFMTEKKGGGQPSTEFKFVYKQDSTFLLLDKKLPYFKLKELDGHQTASTELLGKPTLINFWSTYCGPCIAEMPDLSKLKDKYKDKVNFISITENSAIGDDLQGFLADKKFNFQVLENGMAYKNELKISALPRNLFLDKNGVLRYIKRNYPLDANSTPLAIDDKGNDFTKIIEELIKENE